MGVGPVCWTSLPTGLSEWELGPHHAEQSPTPMCLCEETGAPDRTDELEDPWDRTYCAPKGDAGPGANAADNHQGPDSTQTCTHRLKAI